MVHRLTTHGRSNLRPPPHHQRHGSAASLMVEMFGHIEKRGRTTASATDGERVRKRVMISGRITGLSTF